MASKTPAPVYPGRITTQVAAGIARLVIDNPARHNAITPDMARAACDILPTWAKDPAIRLLVVTGAGEKAFVSGADIESLEAEGGNRAADNSIALMAMFPAVRDFPKPSIALIKGYCFGAGVALALSCDLRLASDTAMFSIPSARLGVGYPANFTRWLVEVVGVARAKEFLLTARRYTAVEAQAMDLVHKLVALREFDRETGEYCMHLSQNAPLSMQAAKAIVNEVANGIGSADLARCEALIDACAQSADHTEGRRAFLEKRSANFVGR